MSVNPTTQFHLRSIVREGRGRRKLRRPPRIADVVINVAPSEDPEKPKQSEVEETATTPTNQFLPGAVALNSFVLVVFLLYLEKKDHIKFPSTLSVSYPSFVGCEDNKHCVLESKEIDLNDTNVTHLFIVILMFVGYLPVHILHLTNNNREFYERVKNLCVICLFSVLFAIVQGQHNILYLIAIALNNFLILGVGIVLEMNYNFKKLKWGYFLVLFFCTILQTIPTITAHYNGQNIPGFLFLLSLLWGCFFLIEVVIQNKPHLGYLHLIVQICMCWTFTTCFWEYGNFA